MRRRPLSGDFGESVRAVQPCVTRREEPDADKGTLQATGFHVHAALSQGSAGTSFSCHCLSRMQDMRGSFRIACTTSSGSERRDITNMRKIACLNRTHSQRAGIVAHAGEADRIMHFYVYRASDWGMCEHVIVHALLPEKVVGATPKIARGRCESR